MVKRGSDKRGQTTFSNHICEITVVCLNYSAQVNTTLIAVTSMESVDEVTVLKPTQHPPLNIHVHRYVLIILFCIFTIIQ